MRAVVLGSILSGCVLGQDADLGDVEAETLGLSWTMPRSAESLKASGWSRKPGGCDPYMGYAWAARREGPSPERPTTLWTTEAGQPSGVSLTYFGGVQQGYKNMFSRWDPLYDIHTLDVAFREKEEVCSGERSTHPVGTAVIVNPRGPFVRVPVSELQAMAGWRPGSCIPGMGVSYMLDKFAPPGEMTYVAHNYFPVTPMYLKGKITGFFFQARRAQLPRPRGAWDEVPSLPVHEMCNNTCDNCGGHGRFFGTATMHTLHFMLRPPMALLGTCDAFQCPAHDGASWCCPRKEVI